AIGRAGVGEGVRAVGCGTACGSGAGAWGEGAGAAGGSSCGLAGGCAPRCAAGAPAPCAAELRGGGGGCDDGAGDRGDPGARAGAVEQDRALMTTGKAPEGVTGTAGRPEPAVASSGSAVRSLLRVYAPVLDAVRGMGWPARERVRSAVAGPHPSTVRGTSAEFVE